ncbi:MAG: hypothetical protein ACKVWV_08455 [Planctomycetota bacterium]
MNRDSTDSEFVGQLGRRLPASDDGVREPDAGGLDEVDCGAAVERDPHSPHGPSLRVDDPHGLYTRCAQRLRERALLLDPLRVCTDTLARAERVACSLWSIPIEAEIDESIDLALAREASRVRSETAPRERTDAPTFFADAPTFFADALGLPVESSSRSAVAFHELDFATRRAFCALLVDNRTLEECERAGLGDRVEVAASARSALRTALLAVPGR